MINAPLHSRYTLLAYKIFVTSNMNILQPKLNLLKDITVEFASSLKSAGNVRNQCENFLNRLEFELTMRLNERAHFITKDGITLRDLLLEGYRRLIGQVWKVIVQVHSEYCAHEEIYLQMTEQYESLQMTIRNVLISPSRPSSPFRSSRKFGSGVLKSPAMVSSLTTYPLGKGSASTRKTFIYSHTTLTEMALGRRNGNFKKA